MTFKERIRKLYDETVKLLLSEEAHEIQTVAAPGLMTLTDLALYRSNEGQLTATVCAANDLLNSFFELKKTAKCMLLELYDLKSSGSINHSQRDVLKSVELVEDFARVAIDCATGVIERITRDRLAVSANLGSNEGSGASSSHPASSTASATDAGGAAQDMLDTAALHAMTTGRRKKLAPTDCWESPRLFCPDYVWADDVLSYGQRVLKSITRHQFLTSNTNAIEGEGWGKNLLPSSLYNAIHLAHIVRKDIPDRLSTFKVAMESNARVSKRLYIVKCEYRAPFRAFLEAHNKLKSAPSASIVDQYIKLHSGNKQQEIKAKRSKAEKRIEELMHLPHFIEALHLEQQCEHLEVGMADMILPFAELARMVDGKRVSVLPVLPSEDVAALQECLRRLQSLMARNSYGVTGIRSLLLDLQGVPRDDDTLQATSEKFPFGTYPDKSEGEAIILRIKKFMSQLKCLVDLPKVKGGFKLVNKNDSDLLKSLLKNCASLLDPELFQAQYEDWYSYVKEQREILKKEDFGKIAEEMRQTEIELGIAVASKSALDMVRKRLDALDSDRQMRLELLQDIMNDLSLREFGISIKLSDIKTSEILRLPETSAMGVFDRKLIMENEPLPIGQTKSEI